MKPKDLAIVRRTNADDVRWVSWILRNITNPEALDAAIRLAGTIRWFDDGIYVNPPYDLVVSTFKACFDPTGKLYPVSRDRAYYSGRAMMRIHTLAMCKSEDFGNTFPLPDTGYIAPGFDHDLKHLTWANQTAFDYEFLLDYISRKHKTKIPLPLTATLNLFLVWCIFLDSPVEEEALKIQDKSYDISSFRPSYL